MPAPRLAPRDAGARPGSFVRLACGSSLLAVALLHAPSAFAPPPAPWAGGCAPDQLELPRGEREPRTQMRGRYATGTRSRKNNQGGGRLPISITRNPVLSYSIGEPKEPSSSVLRRMWDNYDMDFNKMVAVQSRYFRPDYRRKQWTADYNMRMGRLSRERRKKQQAELEWQDWMRRQGRRQGLTEAIPFNGPKLKMTPEEDANSEPDYFKKYAGTPESFKKNIMPRMPKGKDLLPEDIEPGKWKDQGPENIFKIWKRPLHKWPYDIGKQGKWGPVCRNIVF